MEQDMASAKLPTSAMVSLGLHGGALVLFGLLMHQAPKETPRVVEGVDLLIEAPKSRPAGVAVKPPPLSTMDFLKLALPTIPRVAAPAALALKIPEHKLALATAPKLEDRAQKNLPKLEALDLGRRPLDEAKLDVTVSGRRQAAATLAALPRLEDVGRRRVQNLPQALELEDKRREAVGIQGLSETASKPTSRNQALAAMAVLREAAPSARPQKGFGSLLPSRPLLMEARPQAAIVPAFAKMSAVPPKSERRAIEAQAGPAKGVEIEGPLADRRITAYAVPPFPTWLREQGILEADVSIRFTVDENGAVMPDMRVENSSGYGRLDRLAMDSLKKWRFASESGVGVQWGVITFKFVLE